MVSFRITKNGFIGNGSGSLTGSLLGTASHAITASSVAWNDVTGKPSAYPAAAHDHTGDNLKPASVTTTGDVTVGGNLIVNGSQTVIETENLTVKDKLIEIASGSTTKATINGAGIQFGEASLNASIKYENSGSTGAFVSPIDIHAPNIDLSITSISALYRNLGSETQPIYLTTAGPQLAKKYSEAEVKSAGFATSATSAEKLSTSNVGGTGEPVYFENGKPVADAKTKGAVDWVTNNSESLLTPDEVIWKKGTGTDSIVQILTGANEALTPTATEYAAIATGLGTTASGMVSHAEGFVVIASGMVSHAEGLYTTASGDYSHAEGTGSKASGMCSHAEGHVTNASGEFSHAEGLGAFASGKASHAEGLGAFASGEASHAEGLCTTASNDYEHAQGIYNHSSTNQIFSVGAGTSDSNRKNAISVLTVPNSSTQTVTASFFVQNVGGYDGTNPTPGINDLATVISEVSSIWKKGTGQDSIVQVLTVNNEVNTPLATGWGAIAEGFATVASGSGSRAEGYCTTASGDYSHAEGFYTSASGIGSHAEGTGSKASGVHSHAEGYRTTTSGRYSHAEGMWTNTSGIGSHAEGFHTITSNQYEHAQGMYNHTSSNQIFSIGTGESNDSRRNAVSVLAVLNSNNNKYTASVFVQNVGGYNGTNPTPGTNDLATVINGITSNATNGQTAYGWGDHASAGYAKSGDIKTAIDNLVTASGSKWSTDTNTDTKVTSADNHYKPTQVSTSGSSTARYYIKTIGVDSKGHVTSVTTGHETVENTDTKVTSVDNHYHPKQSTAKTASAGSVISGIGLDAAGHVTSITSSNSITNATNATIATKLVGTSGSEGVPVYIDAGVPKACQANLVSLPLSSTGATSGPVILAPGKVHNCGELTGDLTLELDKLDASSTDSHEAIYCCVFNMGPTLKTITLPKDVKVVENSADLDTTNVYYEINIMNNVAIIARTAS